MNGTKPKFLDGVALRSDYYKPPNPYDNAPSCNVNLLELSRYAKRIGKRLAELSKEEVDMFSTVDANVLKVSEPERVYNHKSV